MKKKKQALRRTVSNAPIKTIGHVLTDLVVWDFSGDEYVNRHIADQLSKALVLSYNMGNFGPESFGLEDEEQGEF